MCVHTCECRYAHTNNKNVFISLCGGEAITEVPSTLFEDSGICETSFPITLEGPWGCRHELLWPLPVFWGLNSGLMLGEQ